MTTINWLYSLGCIIGLLPIGPGEDEASIRQYILTGTTANGNCKAKQLHNSAKHGQFSGSELMFKVSSPGEALLPEVADGSVSHAILSLHFASLRSP